MTLASSGDINLAGASSSPQRSILAELGATAPISLISTSTRSLTGIASGSITMPTDFYGKSLLSYSLYLPYTTVTEGNSTPVTALTNGVPDSTVLYWTILNGSTTNADFTVPFGSVTINSGSGQIDITPVSDGLTDGGETFTVQLRTGSTSGSVVATSGIITINDPSAGSYLYYFAYPELTTGPHYFTVLPGMTSIDFVMAGGGGAGGSGIYTGSGSSVAGAGGGGGGQVRQITGYSVTPGEILTINIGAGGSGLAGSAGGISSIQGNSGATLYQAEGGGYGSSTVSSGGVGGTGGNTKNNAGSIIYGGTTSNLSGSGGAGTVSGGTGGGSSQGGAGGAGGTFTIGPYSWNLGGGGGGGNYSTPTPGGTAGFGGGGTGSGSSSNLPTNGDFWTGGGGGGARGRSTGVSSNEYGANGAQGALYFVSTVQPTAKLPFPGIGLEIDYGNPLGNYAQGWNILEFTPDGRMRTEEGTNAAIAYPANVNGSWLTSSPAGTSTSTAGLYDIELTPSAATLSEDGLRVTTVSGDQISSALSTGTAWNTRLQLGEAYLGRALYCDADASATVGGGTVYRIENVDFTATIYLHATNTVVTSTQVSFYVQVYSGTPI
jgi:hypothetical protein